MREKLKDNSLIILKNPLTKEYYPALINILEKENRCIIYKNGVLFKNVKVPSLKKNIIRIFNEVEEINFIDNDKILKDIIKLMIEMELQNNNLNNDNKYLNFKKIFYSNKSLIEILENNETLKKKFLNNDSIVLYNEKQKEKMFKKYLKEDIEISLKIYKDIMNKDFLTSSFPKLKESSQKNKHFLFLSYILNKNFEKDENNEILENLLSNFEHLDFPTKEILLKTIYENKKLLKNYRRSISKIEISDIYYYYLSKNKEIELNILFDEEFHKYFQIFNILEKEEITKFLKYGENILTILQNKNLPEKIITLIDSKKLYKKKFKNKSINEYLIKNKLIEHENVSQILIEKYIEIENNENEENFNQEIIINALSNAKIDIKYLNQFYIDNFIKIENNKTLELTNIKKESILFGILTNKNIDINIVRDVFARYGSNVKFEKLNKMINVEEMIKKLENNGQMTMTFN
jgi:hypothetical protein